MEHSCRNCKYWHFASYIASQGECRRHAPHPYFSMDNNKGYPRLIQPVTNEDYWCGEFGEKSPEQIIWSTPAENLEVSARVANAIRQENITTLGEIIDMTDAEWLRLPNFGRHSLDELKNSLWDQYKLKLRERPRVNA